MEKELNSLIQEKGKSSVTNQNCWLASSLNYNPYDRCRYCELQFKQCPFLHYQIISLAFVVFFLTISFLLEREIPYLLIISVFSLIIVYGHFFGKSTDKLVKANFSQKKAKESLEKLNRELEQQVDDRTSELREAYDELKILDQAKSEFLSIASHQLRTPLTAMRGYLSMLIQGDFGPMPPKAKQCSEEVYRASLRLLKLSNDLLNVSRIETGEAVLSYRQVAVRDLVSSIIDDMKIEAEKKNLYLKMDVAKDIPLVEMDEDQIRQSVLNIVDNALKYTEEGGVVVSVKVTDKENLLIEVKDTGVGLDAKDQKKIFQSFSRGQAGNAFHSAGAGLGLYVARKFVNQHHGRVWVESAGRGRGSAFYIEIPMRKPKDKK